MTDSVAGRIPFYITLEDYEKLLFGGVVDIKISPIGVIQLRLSHSLDKDKLHIRYVDDEGRVVSGRKI